MQKREAKKKCFPINFPARQQLQLTCLQYEGKLPCRELFSYHELELVRSRRRALLLTFVKWPAISRRQTFVYLELDELARALLVDESDGENDADNLKL